MQNFRKAKQQQVEPIYNYYSFSQKPNSGHFILNKERGVSLTTIIQSPNLIDAIKKAQHIGIYPEHSNEWGTREIQFGCPCCQERWSINDIREYSTPTTGTTRLKSITFPLKDAVCIHLMDGTFGFLAEIFEESPYELAKLFFRLHQKYQILVLGEVKRLSEIFKDKTKTKEQKQAMFSGKMFPLPKEAATIKEIQRKNKKEEQEFYEPSLEELEPLVIQREQTANELITVTTRELESAPNIVSNQRSFTGIQETILDERISALRVQFMTRNSGIGAPQRARGESKTEYIRRLEILLQFGANTANETTRQQETLLSPWMVPQIENLTRQIERLEEEVEEFSATQPNTEENDTI